MNNEHNNKHIDAFMKEREELNEYVMKYSDIKIKRFFSLDSQAYRGESLPAGMKELLGLVASIVLRCDDCIKYHLIRCYEEGISDKEFEEMLEREYAGVEIKSHFHFPDLVHGMHPTQGLENASDVLKKIQELMERYKYWINRERGVEE